MPRIFFVSILMLTSSLLHGQGNYAFATDILTEENNSEFKGTHLSFVENYYEETIRYWRTLLPVFYWLDSMYEASNPTTIEFSQIESNMVMINEAHHNPRHRAFFMSKLSELKRLGYTDIFFEALNYDLPEQKLNQDVGFYIRSPEFSNLLRVAKSLDFGIHSYDSKLSNTQLRDSLSANNIDKIIKKNGITKSIIYCGYGHIQEDSNNKLLGYHLNSLGYNPFTIDQTTKKELGSPIPNEKLIKYDSRYYDSRVIHVFAPPKEWKSKEFYNRFTVKLNQEDSKILVFIYDKNEAGCMEKDEIIDTLCPIEIVELNSEKLESDIFVLKFADPLILILDTNGNLIDQDLENLISIYPELGVL